ncbi:MAG TPA: hypothetical protein VG917_02905 [Patescibacteria group bacterium]|nr:hypothetical protein [Patescibacteria group bacterium]
MQISNQSSIEKSIVKTLSYSDIFSYPLTKEEIYKYYIGEKTDEKVIFKTLKEMVGSGFIQKGGELFFLNGRQKFYTTRKTREKISTHKLLIAKRISKKLKSIPTVKLVGISGSLSMNNADRGDDIDLFIVSSSNTVWITRFLVTAYLFILGIKRSRKDSYGMDRICPNMFVSESNMKMDADIFTAHEIAQLKILVNKEQVYERFLCKNRWLLRFLPNIKIDKKDTEESHSYLPIKLLDKIFYMLQFLYMKKRITKETVSSNLAMFHPKNKKNFVINLYKKRYTNYLFFGAKLGPNSGPKMPDLASNFTPGY